MGGQTGNQFTAINYVDWQEEYAREKPFQIFSALPVDLLPDAKSTNLIFKKGRLEVVRDARGVESTFDLDVQGFAFRNLSVHPFDHTSEAEVEKVYLPQLQDLLMHEVPGVDKVHFFDWRIRENKPIAQDKAVIDANDKTAVMLPASHAHIDQAPVGVIRRVETHLPDEAAFLLQGRVRIINIWRPLIPVVTDRPLALCDARTTQIEDLVETDHVRKHYYGANYYALPSEKYEWWYLSAQKQDEATLFKTFDSDEDVGAKYCLHTSFDVDPPSDNAPKRLSIEARALVFTYPKDGQ